MNTNWLTHPFCQIPEVIMKYTLVLLAALACSNVNAARYKSQIQGAYAADTTISQAPPRSTHALIEPDGSL